MRKVFIAVIILCSLNACMHKTGSGNIISRTKNTGSFSVVNIAGPFEAEVRLGEPKVVIEADDNLMNYVKVTEDGEELKVRLEIANVSDAHLKLIITTNEITGLKSSASARIEGKEVLHAADKIQLESSSGSSIDVSLDAPEVKVGSSSGGDVNVKGRTRNLKVSSSSGATIKAGELMSENVDVDVSSGASAHVNASVSVDARASSGGSIRYRGSAINVKKHESSGGGVEKE